MTEPVPLFTPQQRAASINKQFDEAHKTGLRSEYHRLQAGRELIAAHKTVAPGKWNAWCRENIKRSRSDIKQVMAMAGHKEPEKAAKEEREKVAARVRDHREAAKADGRNVPAIAAIISVDLVSECVALFNKMSDEQKARFMAAITT